MPSPQTSSLLEYALIATLVCIGALTLVAALWPILGLIVDGFRILIAVFAGDAAGVAAVLK